MTLISCHSRCSQHWTIFGFLSVSPRAGKMFWRGAFNWHHLAVGGCLINAKPNEVYPDMRAWVACYFWPHNSKSRGVAQNQLALFAVQLMAAISHSKCLNLGCQQIYKYKRPLIEWSGCSALWATPSQEILIPRNYIIHFPSQTQAAGHCVLCAGRSAKGWHNGPYYNP